MKTFIVIPAYNEEKRVTKVIRDVTNIGFSNIIIVDDGSNDETAKVSKAAGAKVIQHSANRGVGAATQTGLQAALNLGAEIIVTMDADGQHSALDIATVIEPIKNHSTDVVIGSRFLSKQIIPFSRRFFNKVGNLLTYTLTGFSSTDSQSGFKAFNRKAASEIKIHACGYEYCSEIFRELIIHDLRHIERPVSVKYSNQSMAKGQHFGQGVEVAAKLVIRTLFK